jgi:hypothetical protein
MKLWVCTTKEFLNKLSEIVLEGNLLARCPHQGLDLTVVWCRNRIQWANGHL